MNKAIPGRYPTAPDGSKVRVQRPFFLSPHDGAKYPADSESIRTTRVEPSTISSYVHRWSWALDISALDGYWVVVPIDNADRKDDINRVRATLWSAGKRKGYGLVSQVVGDDIYFAIRDESQT